MESYLVLDSHILEFIRWQQFAKMNLGLTRSVFWNLNRMTTILVYMEVMAISLKLTKWYTEIDMTHNYCVY